jgi:TP901 family phage tail tape measure protein
MSASSFIIPSKFTAVDKFSSVVKGMANSLKNFSSNATDYADRLEKKFDKIGASAKNVAINSGIAAAAIAAPLAIAAKEAIEFEDKLADVAKTTGMQGKDLENYGNTVLALAKTTRTSIDDILKIGEIGGSLGIAQKDLPAFTDSINKFNVALGADFQGGVEEASSSIGKIKSLFKETRSLNIAEAINKTGSAINELGAAGNATSANITDFTLRIGALPDAIKPTLQDTQALASLFEEAGITSEIAARGFGDVLLSAGTGIGVFAKQMGMAESEAKKLLETDPTKFSKEFAKSLNGLTATELATKLHDLKIGDAGTIKVLGALSTGTERLGELQGIANKHFSEGVSLSNEYSKKNETTAAKIKKAQNNIQAFTITLGTKLLPIISTLLEKYIIPFIEKITKWVKENPKLTKTILIVAASLSALLFTISTVASIVAVASTAIAGLSAAFTFLNAVLFANPIGLIILGIIGLIAVVAIIIKKWDQWGATVSFFLGPLGMVISLFQSFRKNWDLIVKAFKTEGIISGLKRIGATLLDVLLMPLNQVLELIAKFTGADWASSAAKGIEEFRKKLEVNVDSEPTDDEPHPEVNPKADEQDAMIQRIEKQQQNVAIDIRDQTGRANVSSDNNFIPIKLTSTMGLPGR